jgi:hypothetical protein
MEAHKPVWTEDALAPEAMRCGGARRDQLAVLVVDDADTVRFVTSPA